MGDPISSSGRGGEGGTSSLFIVITDAHPSASPRRQLTHTIGTLSAPTRLRQSALETTEQLARGASNCSSCSPRPGHVPCSPLAAGSRRSDCRSPSGYNQTALVPGVWPHLCLPGVSGPCDAVRPHSRHNWQRRPGRCPPMTVAAARSPIERLPRRAPGLEAPRVPTRRTPLCPAPHPTGWLMRSGLAIARPRSRGGASPWGVARARDHTRERGGASMMTNEDVTRFPQPGSPTPQRRHSWLLTIVSRECCAAHSLITWHPASPRASVLHSRSP